MSQVSRLFSPTLAALMAGFPGAAEGQVTSVVPDMAEARSLGTTVAQQGRTFTVAGGVRSGGNLFHSFSQFSLGRGDVARWTSTNVGAAPVINIINRVTGGQVSQIAGMIDTTALPDSNFYFLNPAGVVFSAGAQVNVPGAAHFSSAAALGFSDGVQFMSMTPNGSTLSVAPPQSFGFVGGEGSITVNGVGATFTRPAATLTLTATNVDITGARLAMRGLEVAATGGQIRIAASQIVVSPAGAILGSLRVLGGDVTISDSSLVSDTETAQRGGLIQIEGRDIRLDRSQILSEAYGSGDAGGVSVRADRLLMQFSAISSSTYGVGQAGPILLTARGIVLANSAAVTSDTFGPGDAGGVSVTADEIVVADNASITSETSVGTGNAGAISIDSDTLTVSNGFISSDTEGRGRAGEIRIRTDVLIVTNPDGAGAYISSDSLGDGDAGSVIIDAKSVTVSDQGFISSTAFERGSAGSVVITADTLVVDRGTLSSAADLGSRGGSGDLLLHADTFVIRNGGQISTASFNSRTAGRIDILAGELVVDGSTSVLSSENFSGGPAAGRVPGPVGDAGSVRVGASNLTLSDGGRITTNSFGGAAGDISIVLPASGLLILAGQTSAGSIQTSSGAGTGGRIAISAPRAILSSGGSILALGERLGANVSIQTQFFVNASDRVNIVAVDGNLALEGGVEDVSRGTVGPDLSVLDASRVLRGQCPEVRATGQVSQLITRPVGPHAVESIQGDVRPRIAGACR